MSETGTTVSKDDGTTTCLEILVAVLLPPLGVFFKCGCKIEFWVCLGLTLLAYLPGILFAIWIITKK